MDLIVGSNPIRIIQMIQIISFGWLEREEGEADDEIVSLSKFDEAVSVPKAYCFIRHSVPQSTNCLPFKHKTITVSRQLWNWMLAVPAV